MRVVIGAFPLGLELTGPGVYFDGFASDLARHHRYLDLVIHATSRRLGDAMRTTADRLDPEGCVRAVVSPFPARVLRPLQRHLRVPSMKMLVGPYDVYHQLHLDAEPAVPSQRLVLTVHDLIAERWPQAEGAPAPFMASLLRRAAAVIAVSEFTKSEVCATFGVDASRVHVAHNGVDHHRFQPQADLQQGIAMRARASGGRPYLLCVGGQTPRKNLARSIDAFCRAKAATGYEGILVLAGPLAPLRPDVAQAVADAGDAISVVGFVDDADLPALMRAADGLLLASLYEGFGIPIAEAQACGTRVITSQGTACAEVGGAAAFLVDPYDVDSIADGIGRLLAEGPAERSARVAAGIRQAARFTWEDSGARHAAVYRAVAEGTTRRRATG